MHAAYLDKKLEALTALKPPPKTVLPPSEHNRVSV